MDSNNRNNRDNRDNRDKPYPRRDDLKGNSNYKRPFNKDRKEEDNRSSQKPARFGGHDANEKKVWKKPEVGAKPWESDPEEIKEFARDLGQEEGRAAKFKEENKKKFSKEKGPSFEDDVPFNVKPVKKSSKGSFRVPKSLDDFDDDEVAGYEKFKKGRK